MTDQLIILNYQSNVILVLDVRRSDSAQASSLYHQGLSHNCCLSFVSNNYQIAYSLASLRSENFLFHLDFAFSSQLLSI